MKNLRKDALSRAHGLGDPSGDAYSAHVANTIEALQAEVGALRDKCDAILFHQLCCLGGCHDSLRSLAELAQMIGFEADPATMGELQAALDSPQDWETENVADTYECFIEPRIARADTAEAALAEMRDALMQVVIWHDNYRSTHDFPAKPVQAALSTDAGAGLLERVGMLQEANNRWRDELVAVAKALNEPLGEDGMWAGILIEKITLMHDALSRVLPYMEAAETAGLVGDEGCHWPVELVRAALAGEDGT